MNTPALTQPILFLSHGSPMHAVEAGATGHAWQAVAATLPRPRAILMVSAHWEAAQPTLTASAAPRTIHDFGGFPDALYRLRYAAPGAPALAEAIAARLQDAGIAAGTDATRGLDHGAWVPLLHMFPQADVPVLQLALQAGGDARRHYAIGAALRGLAAEGVLIIASGHMTHNLGDFFRHRGAPAPLDYAQAFRDWVDAHVLAGHVAELLEWETAPGARRAHPTPEHFLPLFVALGAAGEGYHAQSVLSGFDGPALAMDAYRFDPA